MRIPPPGLLKLDRKALLADVRERLADRIPSYAEGSPDPSDPGWLLIEQAAWLVEILTDQLDRYPFSAVQQLVHVMGGHLKPAQPAVGIVVAEVAGEGPLVVDPTFPDLWRLFTPQTERSDAIEFVPVEPEVHLRLGRVRSMVEVRAGELYSLTPPEPSTRVDSLVMWRHRPVRSSVFNREEITYTAMTNNTEALKKSLEGAVAQLVERRVGWLKLRVEQVGKERVSVVATIDPAGAFARTAPGGLWAGGDLVGDWGTLDDSTWTPPVTISDHPLLPMRLRGARPMPAQEEGQILLPDVPQDFQTGQLLVRKASPVPTTVVDAIWKTLANLDADLLPLRPSVRRGFRPADEPDPLEPEWVAGALDSGLWHQLASGPDRTVAHCTLEGLRAETGSLRLAVTLDNPDPSYLPAIRVFGHGADGRPYTTPLKHAIAWRLPSPPRERDRGMVWTAALDVEVTPELTGLLVEVDGAPIAVMMNAVMVANMPAVRDGRRVTVNRNVPEAVSMLFEDLVSPQVVGQLLEQPIPDQAAAVLAKMPLGYFTVQDQEPAVSFAGIQVDAGQGQITLNAPDDTGAIRTFRPGTRIKLNWYRRTDGELGVVSPGAIQLVEQTASTTPIVTRVKNPLGTFFGAARETPEAAIDRMFAPAGGMPVLPSDFEREVRQALGIRGQGWFVRCWSYSERALVPNEVWPYAGRFEPADPDMLQLKQELGAAGPDRLLVVLGPPDGGLTEEDLAWARQVVSRRLQLLGRRMPVVRDAIVTRFWPLTMIAPPGAGEAPFLPCFDLEQMAGRLVDELGREAEPTSAVFLLNAAVTRLVDGGEAAR